MEFGSARLLRYSYVVALVLMVAVLAAWLIHPPAWLQPWMVWGLGLLIAVESYFFSRILRAGLRLEERYLIYTPILGGQRREAYDDLGEVYVYDEGPGGVRIVAHLRRGGDTLEARGIEADVARLVAFLGQKGVLVSTDRDGAGGGHGSI